LLKSRPDLCLILAPRHPERGAEVATLITEHNLSYSQRSAGALPNAQVYLADTLGELGVWYEIAPFAFIGGSLIPVGGHNPFEAAHANTAVISGIYVTNFAESYGILEASGGARLVKTAQDLHDVAKAWLDHTDDLIAAQKATGAVIQQQSSQLDNIATQLIAAIELEENND
jgi:3-deoxy-D-manno-octulosonic-acid transferase